MTEITPDIFRRAVVASVTIDGDGCATAEVYMDGVTTEDTTTVQLDPGTDGPKVILYTIGDVTADSPLSLETPASIAGTALAIKATGQGTDADGAEITFNYNGGVVDTTLVGGGWTTVDQDIATGNTIRFTVTDIVGTGSVLCYLRIRPAGRASVAEGDKIIVQKSAHRQGGHGRWRKA